MNADEMFKELGYEKDIDEDNKMRYMGHSFKFIMFYKKEECIYCDRKLTVKELQAINKKIEELRWNK